MKHMSTNSSSRKAFSGNSNFTEDEEGIRNMCRSIEEMLKEYGEEVTEKNKLEFAKRMIEDGTNPLEKIAVFTGLSVESVEKLASEVRK